jgi:hypothetical protein
MWQYLHLRFLIGLAIELSSGGAIISSMAASWNKTIKEEKREE